MTARIEDGYYRRNSVFQENLWNATIPERDWIEQAACRGVPVDEFFQDGKGGDSAHPRAVALCAECEVRSECLDDALKLSGAMDLYGYRGGTTPSGRRAIRQERRRIRRAGRAA